VFGEFLQELIQVKEPDKYTDLLHAQGVAIDGSVYSKNQAFKLP